MENVLDNERWDKWKNEQKKYCAYFIITIGFYICSCLALWILNLIGIGKFNNILDDGFYVVFVTGLILIGTVTFKKLKI